MRKYHISYENALQLVKEDRPIAHPNAGFREQLGLWERCGYNIYSDGGKTKDEYKSWKRDQEETVTPSVTSPNSPKSPRTPIVEINETEVIDMVEGNVHGVD